MQSSRAPALSGVRPGCERMVEEIVGEKVIKHHEISAALDFLGVPSHDSLRCFQKWAAAISYVWTSDGWLYLAVILDLFARRVVGWSVSDRLHQELALDALRKALALRRPPSGLIHHSDSKCALASCSWAA